jgi:hypothetical protein
MRFLISFMGHTKPRDYAACTWQGELKAVAVAASYHTTAYPRTPILEVNVTRLGPSSRVTPEDGDLADLNEWR